MQHGIARDAVERTGRQVGGIDHTVFHQKQVFARTLAHEARAVQQQGFVVAVIGGFHIGKDGIGVIAHRFGLRHGDIDVVARIAAGFDANALVQAVFAQVSAPGPGGDHGVHGVALGADAQFFAADPHQRANVGTAEFVFAQYLLVGLVELLLAEGNLHAQDFGAVEQALGVLLQAENGGAFVGLVSAHALESAAAIVQGVRKNVHLGIAPVNQLAIHPDGAIAVGNGRNCAHAKKSLWVERPIHDLLFPLKRS